MSYDIHFIKNKDLSIQQSIEFLAKSKVSSEFIFSQAETDLMVSEIAVMNQHTSIEKNKSTDIIFDNFQASLFDSQFTISVPFLKENLAQSAIVQVNCIIDVFLENGCVGIDGQIEKFIDDDYSFKKSFSQSFNVVSASVKRDKKGREFASKAEAEKHYFADRDNVLSLIEGIKEAYPKKKLDFSPESLKNLEWVFYEGLDNEAFGKTLPTKEEMYKLLSMYKAKVYVEQKAYEWKICQNFYNKTLELAIQNKKKMHTIFITPRDNFEDFPDTKKQALLKEYQRDA